jgi:hypothetical protein
MNKHSETRRAKPFHARIALRDGFVRIRIRRTGGGHSAGHERRQQQAAQNEFGFEEIDHNVDETTNAPAFQGCTSRILNLTLPSSAFFQLPFATRFYQRNFDKLITKGLNEPERGRAARAPFRHGRNRNRCGRNGSRHSHWRGSRRDCRFRFLAASGF